MVKNIVIVGGGGGGVILAKDLASKIDASKNRIILITSSHRFVHLPSTLRAVTTSEGQLENESFMEYGTNFLRGKGEVKHATVTSFTAGTPGQVKLSTGETVDYEVLVLATGNKWTGPIAIPATSQEEVKKHLDSWRAKIEKAKSIVLVGGGIVGVELSGEIAHFHKGKPITIVHSEELPLNPVYPDKVRRKVLSGLQKHGISFVGKDRVENFTPSEDGQVTTKNGKVINADLVESLGADALTASKHVRVLPTLQIPNHSNIFAIGDIIDWQEQKQAAKVHTHAGVVAKNVLSLLNGRPTSAEYKGSPEMAIITLGPTDGVAYLGILWGIVLGSWFSVMVKSKTLMISMSKATFA
ncbi:hypothetical protein EST38_g5269 [Candolleomyces aberdarensis]|uniref:FAD/NAD(P)-binding domain-containing protein n=1 Tax=Candolleomyces aberdarensis TaxID=2316362 RepID=A0A4Q2DKU6_9AGAR|nr:hypothetical protein EST38_g5269 [Candolleomyces aberdarensis]